MNDSDQGFAKRSASAVMTWAAVLAAAGVLSLLVGCQTGSAGMPEQTAVAPPPSGPLSVVRLRSGVDAMPDLRTITTQYLAADAAAALDETIAAMFDPATQAAYPVGPISHSQAHATVYALRSIRPTVDRSLLDQVQEYFDVYLVRADGQQVIAMELVPADQLKLAWPNADAAKPVTPMRSLATRGHNLPLGLPVLIESTQLASITPTGAVRWLAVDQAARREANDDAEAAGDGGQGSDSPAAPALAVPKGEPSSDVEVVAVDMYYLVLKPMYVDRWLGRLMRDRDVRP